jgi:hypothetical protein
MQRRSADFDHDEEQEDEDSGGCEGFVLAMTVRVIFVWRFS